jgi:hypothetical protein
LTSRRLACCGKIGRSFKTSSSPKSTSPIGSITGAHSSAIGSRLGSRLMACRGRGSRAASSISATTRSGRQHGFTRRSRPCGNSAVRSPSSG